MNAFFEIIIMIIILGVLVSIHEAGHLAMAKLFNVYCFEYSIGMGPALLKKKRKGGETYFSIRGFPLGGYVSMYGEAEGIQLEEGEQLPPPERSIENIKKWKKVIVLFAGVFLNFLLGLLLIFLSVSIFPQYTINTTGARLSQNDTNSILFCDVVPDSITSAELEKNKQNPFKVEDYQLFIGFSEYNIEGKGTSNDIIVSDDAVIHFPNGSTKSYVAVYSPSTLVKEHYLLNDLYFFEKLPDCSLGEPYLSFGIESIANASTNAFAPEDAQQYSLDLTLRFSPFKAGLDLNEFNLQKSFIDITYSNLAYKNNKFEGLDLKMSINKHFNTWREIGEDWCYYVPYCCSAIFEGIIALFSIKGISQLSGIVGMTAMVGTYSAMGGASTLFLFAGLISINLAFFNLLPFPGLDGYQILVTCIEGATKKKVPTKVKAILTYVGLGLLFALMIFVTIKDIFTLI